MNLKLQIAVLVLGAVFAITGIVLSTRKRDRSKNTIKALGMEFQVSGSALVFFAMGCVLILAALGLGGETARNSDNGSRGGADTNGLPCKVAGRVYNADSPETGVGLPRVDLAYLPKVPVNASPVPMATTDPKGHFQFDCSHIKPEEFPVRLQMKYSWQGGSQIVQSDNQIYIAGNEDLSLYLSPQKIKNWNQTNRAILRIPTSELLRSTALMTPPAARAFDPKMLVVRTNR